ncbi:hypothetical protein PTT_07264 [Pyrenophora teres f. teres 0-1]|uniref:PNPLA domain-containing protein n=1 Tax=Pyrenophora teres f. teres (strain 0-1) TaxID=861557 RepID=E3RH91_PYRTT|nr:hypothetical protein PTT_07264 [Pyrenophora teres f. teres 0-1]
MQSPRQTLSQQTLLTTARSVGVTRKCIARVHGLPLIQYKVRLRDGERDGSYTLPDEGEIPATICQAALATSAATVFFDTVSIGARQFVDGALGANNPVDEVEGEAGNIWSSDTGDLKPLVKCFVSIGTGHPGKKALEDNIETERKFIARWAKHYDEKRYFRFNADQGLQEVGLAEYEEQGRMEAATGEYLQHQAQKLRVRDCIKNLQQKQSVYLDDFA